VYKATGDNGKGSLDDHGKGATITVIKAQGLDGKVKLFLGLNLEGWSTGRTPNSKGFVATQSLNKVTRLKDAFATYMPPL
jgi:hypothetical protein